MTDHPGYSGPGASSPHIPPMNDPIEKARNFIRQHYLRIPRMGQQKVTAQQAFTALATLEAELEGLRDGPTRWAAEAKRLQAELARKDEALRSIEHLAGGHRSAPPPIELRGCLEYIESRARAALAEPEETP